MAPFHADVGISKDLERVQSQTGQGLVLNPLTPSERPRSSSRRVLLPLWFPLPSTRFALYVSYLTHLTPLGGAGLGPPLRSGR